MISDSLPLHGLILSISFLWQHEIRTPLNVVSMGLELLRSEMREEEDSKVLLTTKVAAGNSKSSYFLDLTGDILENTQNAVSVLNE